MTRTFSYFTLAFAAVCFFSIHAASGQQSSCGCGSGDACDHAAHGGGEHAQHRQVPALGIHGGQTVTVGANSFEVVYLPKEIRVYLYGPSYQPESAQGVEGELALHWLSGTEAGRYPLRHVVLPRNSREQDYVGLPIDLSKVVDGKLTATFLFTRLPYGQPQPTVFTQTLALARPQGTAGDDHAAIAQQRLCPVKGTELGSMGEPVKVELGAGRSLFVCCPGCVEKVKATPAFYLAKAAELRQQGPAKGIGEQATTTQQQVCPVTGEKLGSMGDPVRVDLGGGRSLFVCCQGCVAKVKADPQFYLAKVAQSRGNR